MGLLRRSEHPMSPVVVGAASVAGLRPDNQDRAGAGSWWAAVSDGVGGEAGGARAAQLTVEAVAAALAPGADPSAPPGAGDPGTADPGTADPGTADPGSAAGADAG